MIKIKSLINILKKTRFIGCDLGASCLKIVKLDKVNGSVKLIQKDIFKVPDTLPLNERVQKISGFLKESEMAADGQISVNIEHPTLYIRRMDIPKMPERDLRAAIKWNFREYVDGSIDDYIVSYMPIIGFGESEKMPISAFCISKDAVELRNALFKSLGLKTTVITPNAAAILSSFFYNTPWQANKSYVILDLGDSVSNFVVAGNDCLLFSRPLSNLNGRKLVELVMQESGFEFDKADELLKNHLLKKTDESNESTVDMGQLISGFISQLIVEIQRSIDAFCLMYRKDKVDKMYLCGGGICIPDIVARLAKGLGVEVEVLNPFSNILEADEMGSSSSAALYGVAVGLALPGEK